jgi:transposase
VLLLPRSVRILLAVQRIDMRNSIDGLSAVVRNEWKEDLFAGHLFVFVSKRGDRVKILTWEGTTAMLHVSEADGNARRSRCQSIRSGDAHSR